MMNVRIMGACLAAIAAASAAIPSAALRVVQTAASECTALARLSLADTTIASAVDLPAGPFMAENPAAIGPWYTRGLSALFGIEPPTMVPAFCRVTATIAPTPASHIVVELWLPQPAAWNGKLLGTGNGGAGGSIAYPTLMAGVQRGYATANTDMGTGAASVSDYRFGIGHPERVKDWAYRSTHLMTVVAKQIVAAYYGRGTEGSYFAGCSTGGHQAITEARRFPEDYDGIVSGAPDTDVEYYFGGAWDYAATHDDPASYIPPAKIPFIAKAAMTACDGVDGLTDGVIDDPRRCSFDPAALQCRNGDEADCLTAPQAAALKKIYAGPRNPRTGEQITPGMSPGSELGPLGLISVLEIPPDAARPRPVGLARWTRGWKGPGFDWDGDVATVVNDLSPILDDSDPHLNRFEQRGGRLLLYSGWADPAVPPLGVVEYYEALQNAMGEGETLRFARLFMVPGMSHCSSGANVSYFDSLGAIEAWVEAGAAPDRLVAARVVDGVTTRTRPLCRYPQAARWTGRGSTDDAANFTCVAPPPEIPPI